MNRPFISIVLPTKNSMPHIKNAIECLKQQTYKNFEVLIQDGLSTDGTLEYLESQKKFLKIEIVSEADSGIGQAYNRGIARSRGDFLCLSASDECLFEYSLEMALSWYEKEPSAAVIIAGVSLVDKQGNELNRFIPEPFDFDKVIRCENVPFPAGLLNRKIIGNDLYYDESLKTCPDYDFWIRLGSRFSKDQLVSRSEIFMAGTADRTSMSYRVETFEQFSKDKIFILNRFLGQQKKTLSRETLRKEAEKGIYTWACKMAASLDRNSPILTKLYEKLEEIERRDNILPKDAEAISHIISLRQGIKYADWKSKITLTKYSRIFQNFLKFLLYKKSKKMVISVKGGPEPWGYAAQWCFDDTFVFSKGYHYCVKMCLRVVSGAVGVCFLQKDLVEKEIFCNSDNKEKVIVYPISDLSNRSIIIRNAGVPHSVVQIYEMDFFKVKAGEN